VHREDAVLVISEIGELIDVVPHSLVGGVEQVGAVLVNFDTRLWLCFGISVAADVGAPFHDQNARPLLACRLLCHGEAKKAASHDDQVILAVFVHADRLPPSR